MHTITTCVSRYFTSMSGLYLDSNTDIAAKEPEPKIQQNHVTGICGLNASTGM